MKQNKKPSWFSELFCHCVREEPVHENRFTRQVQTSMTFKKAELSSNKQVEQQQWLSKAPSIEVDYEQDSFEKQLTQPKLLNRQLSYFKEESRMHNTSFSEEFHSSMMDMRLLYKCGGLLARQTSCQVDSGSQEWILKLFRECNLGKDLEKRFREQLVPSSVMAAINKRIRTANILLSHDPTGSVLLKLTSCNNIKYLEQDKTFSSVVELGVRRMKLNASKVLKMDIEQKVETVILNLLFSEVYLKNMMSEYLGLGQDIIVILPPSLDNKKIFEDAEQAVQMSEQSRECCSVDLQHVMEGNTVIAKVLYFGDVSEITLNDELNFLYSCLDQQTKKKYNYKLLLKDLRNELGMSELVRVFSKSDLIHNPEQFEQFLSSQQLKKAYLQERDSSSSTESEEDENVYEHEEEAVSSLHCKSELFEKKHQSLSPVKVRQSHSQPQKK